MLRLLDNDILSCLRCCTQLILLSKITPSILIVFTFGIKLSFNWMLICFWSLLLENMMHWDLRLEILKPVSDDHFAMLLAVSCKKCCTVFRIGLLHQKFKSSVKRLAFTGNIIVLVMSFIAKRKRVANNDEPWGIPLCYHWLGICEWDWELSWVKITFYVVKRVAVF